MAGVQIMTVGVEGESGLEPITQFADLKVDARLKPLYATFSVPSTIQQYSWPALLASRDVVGISETGSGKTLAFSVPILHMILTKYSASSKNKIRWVTIAPTRELALQTHSVIESVIPAVCVYGGMGRREQVQELKRKQPLAIVATPGRLQDLLDSEEVDLKHVRFLVLDEADRMLDAGFEPAVSSIVARMGADGDKRQTVLFSATWPSSVQRMATKYTRNPIKITIGNPAASFSEPQANTNITQTVHVLQSQYEKDGYLSKELAALGPTDKAIVFVLYKKEAPRVEGLLRKQGYSVRGLHGDMTQADRNAALAAFRSSQATILIATDVAARGLDIPSVKLVFNYTFPLTVEDYVHRIGRTGRGGELGRAVTLFTDMEKPLAGSLQNVLRQAGQEVPAALLAFGCTVKKRVHKEYGAFYRDSDSNPMPAATRIKFDD